jgi:hypothetical protein
LPVVVPDLFMTVTLQKNAPVCFGRGVWVFCDAIFGFHVGEAYSRDKRTWFGPFSRLKAAPTLGLEIK